MNKISNILFQGGTCQNPLSGTFSTGQVYCGDLPNAVFLKSDGGYDNMDIDCDGANNSAGDCANDPSGQGQTSFKDTVQTFGISDLDANLHSYVVFGNEGDNPSFNPQDHGIRPLSVMAVVCNGQVVSPLCFFIALMPFYFIAPFLSFLLCALVVPPVPLPLTHPVLRRLGRYQRLHVYRRSLPCPRQDLLPQRRSQRRLWPWPQRCPVHCLCR